MIVYTTSSAKIPYNPEVGVLVLAEIELIFFIVACMGLRFGFVTKTVLMIA